MYYLGGPITPKIGVTSPKSNSYYAKKAINRSQQPPLTSREVSPPVKEFKLPHHSINFGPRLKEAITKAQKNPFDKAAMKATVAALPSFNEKVSFLDFVIRKQMTTSSKHNQYKKLKPIVSGANNAADTSHSQINKLEVPKTERAPQHVESVETLGFGTFGNIPAEETFGKLPAATITFGQNNNNNNNLNAEFETERANRGPRFTFHGGPLDSDKMDRILLKSNTLDLVSPKFPPLKQSELKERQEKHAEQEEELDEYGNFKDGSPTTVKGMMEYLERQNSISPRHVKLQGEKSNKYFHTRANLRKISEKAVEKDISKYIYREITKQGSQREIEMFIGTKASNQNIGLKKIESTVDINLKILTSMNTTK